MAQSFTLAMPSRLEEVDGVEQKILEAAAAAGFSERDRFAVKLALEEALANAIKHGNGLDPAKQVQVECTVDPSELCIVVVDEGPGFRPEDVPDPTRDENLDKPYGRGVMLMRAYMNEVTFGNHGNRVRLVKYPSRQPKK